MHIPFVLILKDHEVKLHGLVDTGVTNPSIQEWLVERMRLAQQMRSTSMEVKLVHGAIHPL